jgi:hypothetical protein
MWCEAADWISLAQDVIWCMAFLNTVNKPSDFIKPGTFLDNHSDNFLTSPVFNEGN